MPTMSKLLTVLGHCALRPRSWWKYEISPSEADRGMK